MQTKVYLGQLAMNFLPDLIKADDAIVVSPVKDNLLTGDELGHMIVLLNSQISFEGDRVVGKPFSKSQSSNFKGSFVFVGTNPTYFHHLIGNRIFGKFTDSNSVVIDSRYSGMVSYEFNKILKDHLGKI